MKKILLPPVREDSASFDAIERLILKVFREELYLPLLKAIQEDSDVLKNSKSAVAEALAKGRISFDRGTFTGKFSAEVTKELRSIGAKYSRSEKAFKIGLAQLPPEIRTAVFSQQSRLMQMLARFEQKSRQILPVNIAEKFKAENLFSNLLLKTNRKIDKTVERIGIKVKLTDFETQKIAEGYTKDLQRYIKDWTDEEILKLRERVQKRTLEGLRYDSLTKEIQRSYGQAQNKARFLARQETNLMVAQYKSARYQEAGIKEYEWRCVAGSPKHPVRPSHKKLEGKIFRWDNPPNTASAGEAPRHNNPGEDYNCRCYARPVVRRT